MQTVLLQQYFLQATLSVCNISKFTLYNILNPYTDNENKQDWVSLVLETLIHFYW